MTGTSKDTPMMRQYKEIKEQHRDCVLLFRMGDFYEMFFGDAEEVCGLLNLTLTQRQGVPMAGIPYHALQNYLPRLLHCGKRIAICEQTELPQKGARGISKREVVEIVSPGTAIQDELLESGSNNYLQAFGKIGKNLGMALLDFSTGEFVAASFALSKTTSGGASAAEMQHNEFSEILQRELLLAAPRELLLMEELHDEFSGDFWNQGSHANSPLQARAVNAARLCNRIPAWCFDAALPKLLEFFDVQSLKGFGFEDATNADAAFGAAWVVIEYLLQNRQPVLGHVRRLLPLRRTEQLQLDSAALRNLEIFQNIQDGGRNYTLFSVLYQCQNAMGSRCLHRWLRQPLLDCAQLEQRYEKVGEFLANTLLRNNIREDLAQMQDLERIMSRISTGRANGRDLVALLQSLALYNSILKKIEQSENAPKLRSLLLLQQTSQIDELAQLLARSVAENPPAVLHEGGLIAQGYSAELDELRAVMGNSRDVLDAYVTKEQSLFSSVKLKLKYNKIIGHYFELSKAQAAAAEAQGELPPHFIRRQSLVGNQRYSTEELIELETKLNSADEQVIQLERSLFAELLGVLQPYTGLVLGLAHNLAELDVLAGFAEQAQLYSYVCPELQESGAALAIEAGRHPVVERFLCDFKFVPNSLTLDREKFFALITGPNMAGKSTYLRQNALIVLMAQAGSYVPAKRARIPIVDQIFCRVGASDNLSRGESTFMVEMQEAARILNRASRHSLVIIDEIGRGTSTRDGLAIAQSICEYILHHIQCMTLFATHYHELTKLREQHLKLLCLAVDESGEKIRFLKHVTEGAISCSYGVHVAALAGIPPAVTQRAQQILHQEGTKNMLGDEPIEFSAVVDAVRNLQEQLEEISVLSN